MFYISHQFCQEHVLNCTVPNTKIILVILQHLFLAKLSQNKILQKHSLVRVVLVVIYYFPNSISRKLPK